MLDTRNAFEVDVGTFDNALDYRITKFSEFPEVIEQNRADLEGKTVVSFCTGGIRCEKAAIHMKEVGIDHVYQLEGGILKYFEEVGGAHYHGDCFVFDYRTALNPNLEPTATVAMLRLPRGGERRGSTVAVLRAGQDLPGRAIREAREESQGGVSGYRGRFAPSPTGPLHIGSLVSALASYLDARAHRGAWIVRIEDVDGPRTVPDAADDILSTLARFGMHADEPPVWQSQREAAYEHAFGASAGRQASSIHAAARAAKSPIRF